MADIKGAQTLLCRRMEIRVLRRLLSVSEKDNCGGGDDVIPEVMMAFVIMIVVLMLSLMTLVITFLVLISGLDKLSGLRNCPPPSPHNY